MGLYQKGGRKIVDWIGWEYTYKPTLTHQAVYLKEEGRTVMLPAGKNRGFITTWTTDCLSGRTDKRTIACICSAPSPRCANW